MKPIRLSWMLVAILTSGIFFASCDREAGSLTLLL